MSYHPEEQRQPTLILLGAAMGKKSKQGSALRTKQRTDLAARETQQVEAAEIASGRPSSRSDSELFVLDTDARNVGHLQPPKKKRKYDANGNRLPKNRVSEKDGRKAKALLEAHGDAGVLALAEEGRVRMEKRGRARRLAGRARAEFDLWDEDASDPRATKSRIAVRAVTSGPAAPGGTSNVSVDLRLRTPGDGTIPAVPANPPSNKLLKARDSGVRSARPSVAVDVAAPGQSYRPDPEAHQDALGRAVHIELKRKEDEEYKKAPVGGGGVEQGDDSYIGEQ